MILSCFSVSNLNCKPEKPGVIALNWDVNYPDCPIQMYNVTWNFESLWSDDKGETFFPVFKCVVFVIIVFVSEIMVVGHLHLKKVKLLMEG